jgi:hypothetical protein
MKYRASSPSKGPNNRITVRAIYRDPPDARGMARALIGIGLDQLEKETTDEKLKVGIAEYKKMFYKNGL